MLPGFVARSVLLSAGLCLVATLPAAAQLQGRVLDAQTGEPVDGSGIVVLDAEGDTVAVTETRADGRFGVFSTLAPGEHLIGASVPGYDVGWTLFDYAGEPMAFEFLLERAPVALEGIAVEVESDRKLELNGFYERSRRGFGDHLTFSDPASRIGATRPSQLIRRLAGVSVTKGGTPYFPRVQGQALAEGRRGLCGPAVWVDGIYVFGTFDDVVPPVEDIVAIEAYPTGSTTPAQWRTSNAGCGTILIWTR